MRNLILTAAFVAMCGGAQAADPTTTDWQGFVNVQTDIATIAALREVGGDLSAGHLRQASDRAEDAIREHLQPLGGARYPCVFEKRQPTPFGVSNIAGLISGSCNVAIGLRGLQNATTMNATIAIGNCSGMHLETESRDILIGHYTSAPRGRNGFVNIANKLCFWRDTGERVACTAPEPECGDR